MTRRAMLALSGLALATLLGGCAGTAVSPEQAGEVVRTRCTRCHDTTRIKAAAARDRAFWEATVDRMRGRGARINDAERDAVVEYLSEGGATGL